MMPGQGSSAASYLESKAETERLAIMTASLAFVQTYAWNYWRRKWQPTPVFLPGESQGRGSLVGCRLWGRTELDTTEVT